MVATLSKVQQQERRRHPRVPGRGQVSIRRLDRSGEPGRALGAFELLDVSAGGLALLAVRPVKVGTVLHVTPDYPEKPATFAPQPFCVQVLSCLSLPCASGSSDRPMFEHKLRCKLVIGSIPADLAVLA